MKRLKNFLENVFLWRSLEKFLRRPFFFFFFFWRALALVSLVLGLGLEHSCPWPRECLSSERLSLALALASDFFCVLGLGLEPCVLDSTSANNDKSFKLLLPNLVGGLFSFLEQKSAIKALKTCYFAYFSGQWPMAYIP